MEKHKATTPLQQFFKKKKQKAQALCVIKIFKKKYVVCGKRKRRGGEGKMGEGKMQKRRKKKEKSEMIFE